MPSAPMAQGRWRNAEGRLSCRRCDRGLASYKNSRQRRTTARDAWRGSEQVSWQNHMDISVSSNIVLICHFAQYNNHNMAESSHRIPSKVGLLKALANPGRLRVLECLAKAGSPLSPKQVQMRLGISAPTLSHHLERLEYAKLIARTRRGAAVTCWAHGRALIAISDFLRRCGEHAGQASRADRRGE